MNAFDIFQGIVSLLALMLGVTVVYLLAKGGWLLVLRGLQAIGRFVRGLFHNPHQAVVDMPFLIQLLLLPFCWRGSRCITTRRFQCHHRALAFQHQLE